MNNYLTIKGKKIGEGIPMICVPVMEKSEEGILSEIRRLAEDGIEMIEWRVDAYENYHSLNAVRELLEEIKPLVKDTILMLTYRSQGQGGLGENNGPLICSINEAAAEMKVADIIDFEYFAAEKNVRLFRKLQKMGAKVIASHHDYDETPKAEIIRFLLEEEFESGADIVKLAVTPKNINDVLTVLSETAYFHKEHPDTPVVAISMGPLGTVTRYCGEAFGSCITFAAGAQASAPGQIPVSKLREILKLIHETT